MALFLLLRCCATCISESFSLCIAPYLLALFDWLSFLSNPFSSLSPSPPFLPPSLSLSAESGSCPGENVFGCARACQCCCQAMHHLVAKQQQQQQQQPQQQQQQQPQQQQQLEDFKWHSTPCGTNIWNHDRLKMEIGVDDWLVTLYYSEDKLPTMVKWLERSLVNEKQEDLGSIPAQTNYFSSLRV